MGNMGRVHSSGALGVQGSGRTPQTYALSGCRDKTLYSQAQLFDGCALYIKLLRLSGTGRNLKHLESYH